MKTNPCCSSAGRRCSQCDRRKCVRAPAVGGAPARARGHRARAGNPNLPSPPQTVAPRQQQAVSGFISASKGSSALPQIRLLCRSLSICWSYFEKSLPVLPSLCRSLALRQGARHLPQSDLSSNPRFKFSGSFCSLLSSRFLKSKLT